mmetsp:Transcript_26171/g.56683  ORF Transcript_26171/g.56683 Transcript_26171/m.56683 type:complete len:265 (+) Transcript_26171:199-993(+)
MGCVSSSARAVRAPPVDHVPEPTELKKFELMSGEPHILHTGEDTDYTNEKELVRFHIDKSSKSNTGATFIVYDMDVDEEGNRKTWNHLFVQGVKWGLGPRKRLENLTGIFRGEDDSPPLSYWVCDASKGPNNYLILQDQKRSEKQQVTHFNGKDGHGLYMYASIEYNLETTVCSVIVMGMELYRMRQANEKTWIVYRKVKKDASSYGPCALFEESKGSGGIAGRYPRWDVTISPGLDPLLFIHFCTMTDYFYEEYLRKTHTKYY